MGSIEFIVIAAGFALVVLGAPLGLGLALGAVRPARRSGLIWAAIISSMFVLVVVANSILYDRGNDLYLRSRFWGNVAQFFVGLVFIVSFGHALGTIARTGSGGSGLIWPPLAYLIAAVAAWQFWYLPTPLSGHSDAVMIEHFRQHEGDLNRLADLYEQDGRPLAVCAPGHARWGEITRLGPERRAEYDATFEAAGIRHGITSGNRRNQTMIAYWSVDGDQYLEKGYIRVDGIPGEIVKSLDGNPVMLGYRHIDGSWYLYFWNQDSLAGPCE